MVYPEWYEALLLALLSWRVFFLLGHDDILDRPRRYVTSKSRWLKDLIECPFCLGFWVAGAMYAAWLSTLGEWPSTASDAVVAVGFWFALSALVIGAHRVLADD